jgi:hypothetical protein
VNELGFATKELSRVGESRYRADCSSLAALDVICSFLSENILNVNTIVSKK